MDPLGLAEQDEDKQAEKAYQDHMRKEGLESLNTNRSTFGTEVQGNKVNANSALGSMAQSEAGGMMSNAVVSTRENLIGENRGIVSDILIGLTPAGVGHDVLDIGFGLKELGQGNLLTGGALTAGGAIGFIPLGGDVAKHGIKQAAKLFGEGATQLAQEGMQKGAKTAVDAVKEGGGEVAEKLFRGVPGGDTPKAILGKQGIAKPRGTALDGGSLRKHVLGEDVASGVTSWTPDRNIAKRFSGSSGTIIETNAKNVADKVVPRPNVMKYADEKEVLLKGTIQGKATRP